MTPDQITMVKDSWQQVTPIADQAAQLFYDHLFEKNPQLKPLFKSDMKSQGKKLMTMITTAVNSLDKLEVILPAVEDLGKRHVGYGVVDDHYDAVGTSLLWTLEQGLGDAFTEDVKEAWTETYVALAGVMKQAAAAA
ncbi:MAG: globin family protein [Pseudomonadota bacterium]